MMYLELGQHLQKGSSLVEAVAAAAIISIIAGGIFFWVLQSGTLRSQTEMRQRALDLLDREARHPAWQPQHFFAEHMSEGVKHRGNPVVLDKGPTASKDDDTEAIMVYEVENREWEWNGVPIPGKKLSFFLYWPYPRTAFAESLETFVTWTPTR